MDPPRRASFINHPADLDNDAIGTFLRGDAKIASTLRPAPHKAIRAGPAATNFIVGCFLLFSFFVIPKRMDWLYVLSRDDVV